MPGPIRKDPPRKPTDALTPYNAVKNPKEGFHYVLVSLDGKDAASPEYYEMLGWKPVMYEGDKATRLGWGKWKENQPITSMGQILMEMDDERWNELEERGMNGQSGRASCEQLKAQMLGQGGASPVRPKAGMGAGQRLYAQLDADTTDFLGR
jgi:hypothetical protein